MKSELERGLLRALLNAPYNMGVPRETNRQRCVTRSEIHTVPIIIIKLYIIHYTACIHIKMIHVLQCTFSVLFARVNCSTFKCM